VIPLLWAPLIYFDCKRLQSILAALKDQNAFSMVNSTASGHFDLLPCQNRFRSFSSEKQLLQAPLFLDGSYDAKIARLQCDGSLLEENKTVSFEYILQRYVIRKVVFEEDHVDIFQYSF